MAGVRAVEKKITASARRLRDQDEKKSSKRDRVEAFSEKNAEQERSGSCFGKIKKTRSDDAGSKSARDKDMDVKSNDLAGASRSLIVFKLPFIIKANAENRLSEKEAAAQKRTKALALLGGQKVLDDHVFADRPRTNTRPFIFFQPDAIGSQSTAPATEIDRSPAVLRVTRGCVSGKIRRVEFLGTANRYYTFDQLADFVYRPDAQKMNFEDIGEPGVFPSFMHRIPNAMSSLFPGALGSRKGVESSRLHLCVPPGRFLLSQPSNKYTFPTLKKTVAIQEEQRKAQSAPHRTLLATSTLANLSYPVPMHSKSTVTPANVIDKELIALLNFAFDDRPCWTASALQEFLASKRRRKNFDSFERALDLIGHVAYQVISGPFQMAFVKYGFDPRKNSSSSQWQSLTFSLEGDALATVEAYRAKGMLPRLCGINISTYNTVHMRDIRCIEARSFAMKLVQPTYDSTNGWYTQDGLEQIKNSLVKFISVGVEKMKEGSKLSKRIEEGDIPTEFIGVWEDSSQQSPHTEEVPIEDEIAGYDILGSTTGGMAADNSEDEESFEHSGNESDDV